MLCPPPPTLNPVTSFEAARLPHRANPSRAAGSFSGQTQSIPTHARKSACGTIRAVAIIVAKVSCSSST